MNLKRLSPLAPCPYCAVSGWPGFGVESEIEFGVAEGMVSYAPYSWEKGVYPSLESRQSQISPRSRHH
jgi:high-affinity Fe2+/Pb2+ permease